MRQSVKALLFEAIHYDEPYLAHAIYFAVQKGFVKLEDPASAIPYEQLDYTAIMKMRDDNQLKICGVKFFIVPMGSKKFALYLAEKEEEVRAEHQRIYKDAAFTVLDVSHKMDTTTYCEETKKWQSFRELKRQVVQFPYYAGEICGR